MSSESHDLVSNPICTQDSTYTSNADVDGIAVAVASKFSPAAGNFLLDHNLVLLVSDVVVNLCFRAFRRLPGCWLG